MHHRSDRAFLLTDALFAHMKETSNVVKRIDIELFDIVMGLVNLNWDFSTFHDYVVLFLQTKKINQKKKKKKKHKMTLRLLCICM